MTSFEDFNCSFEACGRPLDGGYVASSGSRPRKISDNDDPVFIAFSKNGRDLCRPYMIERSVLIGRIYTTISLLSSIHESEYYDNGIFIMDFALRILSGDSYQDIIQTQCNFQSNWIIPQVTSDDLLCADTRNYIDVTKIVTDITTLSYSKLYHLVYNTIKVILGNIQIDQKNRNHQRWVIDRILRILSGPFAYQQIIKLYNTECGHWLVGEPSLEADLVLVSKMIQEMSL